MPTNGAIFMAFVVGCLSFVAGLVVMAIVWAVGRWMGAGREVEYIPEPVDRAAEEAEARLTDVYRQAHEMLATTVMQGTADDAELDALLKASKRRQPGNETG